jgi:hypothetical protein
VGGWGAERGACAATGGAGGPSKVLHMIAGPQRAPGRAPGPHYALLTGEGRPAHTPRLRRCCGAHWRMRSAPGPLLRAGARQLRATVRTGPALLPITPDHRPRAPRRPLTPFSLMSFMFWMCPNGSKAACSVGSAAVQQQGRRAISGAWPAAACLPRQSGPATHLPQPGHTR